MVPLKATATNLQPKRLQPGRIVIAVPEGWNANAVIQYFQDLVCEKSAVTLKSTLF